MDVESSAFWSGVAGLAGVWSDAAPGEGYGLCRDGVGVWIAVVYRQARGGAGGGCGRSVGLLRRLCGDAAGEAKDVGVRRLKDNEFGNE